MILIPLTTLLARPALAARKSKWSSQNLALARRDGRVVADRYFDETICGAEGTGQSRSTGDVRKGPSKTLK